MQKVCVTIELKSPTHEQINNILNIIMPTIQHDLRKNIVEFIQGDLRKLKSTYEIYKNQQNILKNQLIQNMFQQKNYNKDVKEIIKHLKDVVSAPFLPDKCYSDLPDGKSGNRKLAVGCVYCEHKRDCWSDANGGAGLRAFKYSQGKRYLT